MNRTLIVACLSVIFCGLVLAQRPASAVAQQTKPEMAGAAIAELAPATQPGPAAKKKRSAAQKKSPNAPPQAEVAPPAVAPVTPTPPPLATPQLLPTLMNQPPVSPTVTLRNGLLTIDAPNCTLSEVLNGVRQATGAVLEGVSPSDRVAVRLGPGSPREVVAALLQGTPYDYLILGSERDPNAVTRILLTQGTSSSEPPPPPQPAAVSPPPAPEQPPEFFPEDESAGRETMNEGTDQARPPMTPQPPVDSTQPAPPQPQNQPVPQPLQQ